MLLDTQNLGLPTLHEVLQSVFLYTSSGLLTIGAICSAVFRKNGMYMLFDSHSHGENGLSSNDGTSCLITFTSINDLVTYMYAFYDSLNLDTNTNLQFDFLPIKIKKTEETQSCKDQMEHNMEAYFNDQRLRQAHKAQIKQSIMPSISMAESKKALGAKRKNNRMEYYKTYRRKCRQNPAFKAKERDSKQSVRTNPVFKAKETVYQLQSKQSARKDPVFKRKETVYQLESKQSARKDPVFKRKEIVYQLESKQSTRKDPVFKTKERESKQSVRGNPVFKAKETVYRCNQSNQQEKTLCSKEKKLCISWNQSNQQEKTMCLKEKKLCISCNQSNQQEKTLCSKEKKLCISWNQSNQQEKTLCSKEKKLCISWNQSNQQEKTLCTKQKKENQSNL